MVVVMRRYGLRVIIYRDDHPPAHVHVIGDGEAKIVLFGDDGAPKLLTADGFKRSDVRRAMDIVTDNRDDLLRRWREIHG